MRSSHRALHVCPPIFQGVSQHPRSEKLWDSLLSPPWLQAVRRLRCTTVLASQRRCPRLMQCHCFVPLFFLCLPFGARLLSWHRCCLFLVYLCKGPTVLNSSTDLFAPWLDLAAVSCSGLLPALPFSWVKESTPSLLPLVSLTAPGLGH